MQCPNCQHVSVESVFSCSACGQAFNRPDLEHLRHLAYVIDWLDQHGAHAGLAASAQSELQTLRSRLQALPAPALPAAPVAPRPLPAAPPPYVAPEVLPLLAATLADLDTWVEARALSLEASNDLRRFLLARHLVSLSAAGGAVPSEERVLLFARHNLTAWMNAANVPITERVGLQAYVQKRLNALSAPVAPPLPKLSPAPLPAAPPVAAPVPAPIVSITSTHPKLPAVPASLVAAPAAMASSSPAPAQPQPVHTPPPRPPAPPINWGEIWERGWRLAVSGALLRGLLYLGAFMIVASAVVLVVAFWRSFNPLLQIGFIAAVPLSFYGGGFVLGQRLKLPMAGSVFTSIGALLVAVDFAAVYQLGGLRSLIAVDVYWLGASVFCAALYAFTSWRLHGEFYAYLVLVGLVNVAAAFTAVLPLPLEWQVVSLGALSAGLVGLSGLLRARPQAWPDLALPARRLPQFVFPLLAAFSVILALFVGGDQSLVQALTLALVALGYAGLARQTPSQLLVQGAVWASAGAAVFGLQALALAGPWWALAMTGLAFLYSALGRGQAARWPADPAARPGLSRAWNIVAALLLIGGVFSGLWHIFSATWPASAGLALAAGVLVGWAYLFRKPVLVLLGAAGLIVPVTAVAWRLIQAWRPGQELWVLSVWTALALAYVGAAALRPSAARYGRWLTLVAHVLTGLVMFVFLVFTLVFVALPAAGLSSAYAVPALASGGGMLAVYVLSAALHHSGRHPAVSSWVGWLGGFGQAAFFWPMTILAPVGLLILWVANSWSWLWLGVALAAAGLVYVALGQGLARFRTAYRLPWHALAYPLTLIGVLMAGRLAEPLSPSQLALVQAPLLSALCLAVAVLASLAWAHRRVAETALAALLFLWPLQIALDLTPLVAHAHALAHAAVASLLYIPLGLRLRRTAPAQSLPLFVVGYAAALGAVLFSLVLGRFGGDGPYVPWVGLAVPLLVTGLAVYSAQRLPARPFAWASAPLLALAFGAGLSLVNLPPVYHAAAWVVLAAVYLVGERVLTRAHSFGREWVGTFRVPLAAGALALWLIGLGLTAADTLRSLITGVLVEPAPVLLAQGLGVLALVLAARLYRSRWPLFGVPVLALVVITLATQALNAYVFGLTLTLPQFGLVWAGLAVLHLAAGALLDRSPVRYAHAPYLGGYALGLLALAWSLPEQLTSLIILGLLILVAVWSQVWVHFGRHRSFADLLRVVWPASDALLPSRRVAEQGFLFVAAYALPFWVALALAVLGQSVAVQGLGLALLAPLYVALGRRLRRARPDYTWPLYSAAYALTLVAAVLAIDTPAVLVWVLAVDAALFAASAVLFRQPVWLYLSNLLVPVIALLVLHLTQHLTPNWAAPVLMGLAGLNLAAAQLFDYRRRGRRLALAPYALPFLAPGYLLSVVALVVAVPSMLGGDNLLAVAVYSAGVALYAASAWLYQSTFFLYPAAWLAAVPYFLTLNLLGLPARFVGLACLPLSVAALGLGRLGFHRRPLRLWPPDDSLGHPATPFYLLAYGLSVGLLLLTPSDLQPYAAGAAAALYLGSAVLFRRPAWVYPGLLAVHWALLSALTLRFSDLPPAFVSLPFQALTWLTAAAGYAFNRQHAANASHAPAPASTATATLPRLLETALYQARPLYQSAWARPFFLFMLLDVGLWQWVAGGAASAGLAVAGSHALLLALLGMAWLAPVLAYGALGFLVLGVAYALTALTLPTPVILASLAGLGFGLALVARLAAWPRSVRVLQFWVRPLDHVAQVLTGLSTLLVLGWAGSMSLALTASLTFAGAHALLEAYRRRSYRLGYFALALLLAAWSWELLARDVPQPQWYALPAGLYLCGVGYFERRIGRKQLAVLIEGLGLAVLLLTSFIQSLDGGAAGLPYFILLLIEALLVIGWGAARRLKGPFFVGLFASVLNVLGQVVLLFAGPSTLIRWIIIGAAGLLIVGVAIFVERQRERIIATTRVWREALEQWD